MPEDFDSSAVRKRKGYKNIRVDETIYRMVVNKKMQMEATDLRYHTMGEALRALVMERRYGSC